MTRSVAVTCFIALALSTSACGFFGSPDSKKQATDEPAREIGGGVNSPTTRARAAVATTAKPATTAVTAPRPATPGSCRPGNDKSEVRYDPGLIVALAVSTTCVARATDLKLTLTITNKSNENVRYNPNQVEFFSIKAPRGENRSSWRDRDCEPARPGEKTALTLAAGQAISFTGLYPASAGVANREVCRKLENGAYDVHGVFLLCEGAAFQDGYCDISKAEQLFAQPVRINVTA